MPLRRLGGARTCAPPHIAQHAAAALAFLFFATTLQAHQGHDHGGDKAALEIVSLDRAAAASDRYQVVAVLDRDLLVVTIDRAGSNTPVTSADVTIAIGSTTRKAAFHRDGTYALPAPELSRTGRHELVVTIIDGTASDLLIMPLDRHEPVQAGDKSRILSDTPTRLTDGSVFLPKVTQRLLGLQTSLADAASIEPAYSMVGRIIADPNRSGVVQSTIVGRIGLTDAGRLPRLGEPVKAGDVLAIVAPAFAAIDLTNVQQTAGDLDQQIALAQNKVEQFRPLVRSNTMSQERLRTVEIELESLKKRRATLTTSQRGAELLTAPVDGVIASMRAVPGQVVGPTDVLFQIVDPTNLWVEALVFDPSVPDLLTDASATAAGMASLSLQLIGRSRALQQLSTVIHFAVREPPASLNIGSPVTVLARMRAPVTGLVLPKTALVASASGSTLVWVQTEPERFQPRAVRIRPIDGERVLVEAGLEAGEPVVTVAAELINQVR